MRIHLLVVANRTADAPELLANLKQRAEVQPVSVTLLVPATWADRDAASQRAERAVAALREAGLEAELQIGDADPVIAVQEAWDPRRYDEVLVATLPLGSSRWLRCDLPHRVEGLTGATVHHLEVRPPRPPRPAEPPPARQRQPLLVGVLAQMRAGLRRPAAR